ncbi:MAG: acyl-CoA/acyl-ACP dehydrogenase [Proteobacteria bacterium]|nr:acyl-CoA/acyl-ACP dehydrogenase [Pseudomonadota bacterium]
MAIVDIEVGLTDEQRAAQLTAHRFASEVLRPAGRQLDALTDPADVIADGSVLWKTRDRFREMGLDLFESEIPEDPDELLNVAKLRYLVWEEMGWGDAGLAISLGVAGFHKMFAQVSGNQVLLERYCSGSQDTGCWAITEPDHGSDQLAVTQGVFKDSSMKPNCTARRDGDDYVISGQKAAWVSNGSIADVAVLFCAMLDGEGKGNGAAGEGGGVVGGGVVLVPLNSPGVSRGAPLDKLGQRALNQGEIFFDEVRLPADYVVAGPGEYDFALENTLVMANMSMGAMFTGLARAALDHAVEYAHERVQGGRPIFEHQSVKARLFRMFTRYEASRALSRRVITYNGTSPEPLLQYSIASKVFCTTSAFENASDAVQIFGGNGLSREYPVEKLLRDARASMIEDGCNEVLSLVGADSL